MKGWRKIWCTAMVVMSVATALAQNFPPGFARQLVSGSLTQGTAMAFAADGRIFVTQQSGNVRIVKEGVLLPTPFLTLIVDNAGERGLIGIAIDPDFASNNFIYLYYTVPGTPAHNRVSRFTANGDVVLAASETILLDLDPLGTAAIHNGGALAFGNDGKLYIGVGDNSASANAQNVNTHLGKILRMNADGSIPVGNPYPDGSAQAKLVWQMGFRNPYTISVNRENGKIFAIDVGANAWEEINDITTGGKNFGWPADEGNSTDPQFSNPVYTYPHGTGDGVGCAITGGTFFVPTTTNYPSSYYGKFFFQDFCEEWINTIDPSANPVMAAPYATEISSRPLYISTGTDGNLYYISRSASLYRIVYNDTSPPFITHQPQAVETLEGTDVMFEVSSIGSTPFTFQWQKDGVDIAGATAAEFSIEAVEPADAGSYTLTITNVAGSVTSNAAMLTVIPVVGLPDESNLDHLVIYPNPAKGMALLHVSSATNENASIVISDPFSKANKRIDVHLVAGLNQIQLPIAEFSGGVYIVSIQTSKERKFITVVRVKK